MPNMAKYQHSSPCFRWFHLIIVQDFLHEIEKLLSLICLFLKCMLQVTETFLKLGVCCSEESYMVSGMAKVPPRGLLNQCSLTTILRRMLSLTEWLCHHLGYLKKKLPTKSSVLIADSVSSGQKESSNDVSFVAPNFSFTWIIP